MAHVWCLESSRSVWVTGGNPISKEKKKEGQKPFSQLVHNQDRAQLKIDPDGQLLWPGPGWRTRAVANPLTGCEVTYMIAEISADLPHRGVSLSCTCSCCCLVEYDCHRLLLKYACLGQCSAILSLPWDWQIWLLLPRRQSRVQSQPRSLNVIEREMLLAFCQPLRVWGVFVMQHSENQVDRYTSQLTLWRKDNRSLVGAVLSFWRLDVLFCTVSVSPTAHEREALSPGCWCELMEEKVGGP